MKIEPPVQLDPECYREVVSRALAEDVRTGDITTDITVTPGQRGRGELRTREECVVAGLDIAVEAFRQLDVKVTVSPIKCDGDPCAVDDLLVVVDGQARALLTAERTALNFLQRLSGVATEARRFVEVVSGRSVLLDTRKTTPMLRLLEKYAARVGGVVNHRFALDDGVLVKDNHVRLAGSIGEAVARLRKRNVGLPIEVEVSSLQELNEALAAKVDIVLMDNFSLEGMQEAISRCRGLAKTEISGGVVITNIGAVASLRPTYISVGALTHSAAAIDMSFNIVAVT